MSETPLRVLRLQAENLKRLRAVDITPDQHVVTVTGRNAQGKSSVLDAIAFAIGGGRELAGTPTPIRRGAEHASVELDLGELVVKRTWTQSGSKLTVTTKEGAKLRSPQAVLDELLGRFSFDPLAFLDLSPKEQVAALLEATGQKDKLDELDGQRASLYDQRTEIGREVKRLEGHLASLPTPPDEDLAAEPKDSAEILARLQAAREASQGVEQLRDERTSLDTRIQGLDSRIDELERELARARVERERLLVRWGEVRDELTAAGADVDTAALEAELASVNEHNERVRRAREWAALRKDLEKERELQQAATEDIAAIDANKARIVREARLPVEGLGFDDAGVTLHDVPFTQASSAEQLRTAVALNMRLTPRLRVIRIRAGNDLDDDSFALVCKMAHEEDYQVWIERVGTDGTVGILIEDGEVVNAPAAEVAAAVNGSGGE